MRFLAPVFAILFCLSPLAIAVTDDQPVTLLGTIAKWQYPDSNISGAEVSDAGTVDANGKRTVASVVFKTTMTTQDSVEDVLKFYRTLLTRDPKGDDNLGDKSEAGRSVTFSDESDGRPFAFHTILVNTSAASTTLIVTRGVDENETRITWKRYSRHQIGG